MWYSACLYFMMTWLLLNSIIMTTKQIYRVVFRDQGEIYEIYAKQVLQSDMYGFIEVTGFIFGARTQLVVDPSEEKLKTVF